MKNVEKEKTRWAPHRPVCGTTQRLCATLWPRFICRPAKANVESSAISRRLQKNKANRWDELSIFYSFAGSQFLCAFHFRTFFIVSTSLYTVLSLFAFIVSFAWRTSISYQHFCTPNLTLSTPDQQHGCLRFWRRTVAVAMMHGLPPR